MRRLAGSEAVWIALLLVFAAWWGGRSVQQFRDNGRQQVFYQRYFEPAVMIACGHGFASAVTMPAALDDFLQQRADRFDCAQLPRDAGLKPAAQVYQYAWYYLMGMVGLFWKVAGVSWSGLVPLFGLLFACVIGLAYAVFRIATPAWASLPAAAALTFSVMHLQNLPHLRDYAKAPFVLALFLLLALMVARPPAGWKLIAWCAAYGLVLGIGYGFRTDLLANIPPLVATVLLFVPGYQWRDWPRKFVAVAVALAVFAAVARPVITYVSKMGGCQWHAVLLGLDQSYTRDLAVTPSYYQWITHYSDEYMVTTVNSGLHRLGRSAVEYCSEGYDAASGREVVTIAQRFPADLVTRGYASILRVMDLPFYLWSDPDPSIARSHLGQLLTYVAGTARLAMLLAVLGLAAVNLRWGLFAFFSIIYFGGYPSLQFSPRHFFHLEFLGWWALAIVGAHGWRMASTELRSAFWRRGLAFGAVTVGVLWAVMPAVDAYQDRSVSSLTEQLLAAERTAVPATPVAGGLDLDLAGAAAEDDPTQTVYLDIQFDINACPNGAALGVRYDASDSFRDFSAAIVPQPPGTVMQRLMLPVFRGFEGVTVKDTGCIRNIERLRSVAGLPLLPTLTLPVNWRERPAHQRIGGQAVRLWGIGE